MPETTRDRIVSAAVAMTTSSGWASVTMARLAQEAVAVLLAEAPQESGHLDRVEGEARDDPGLAARGVLQG